MDQVFYVLHIQHLFTAIGTAYGTADGTHFNVPDFRGIFPRGVTGTVVMILMHHQVQLTMQAVIQVTM